MDIRSTILSIVLRSTVTGGAIGAALIAGTASAQTTSTTAPAATAPAHDPSQGGHVANGITETLLTGDAKAKVEAAALKAVPGGTIERVENDAEGAAYEAHMTKADGSLVTVLFNSDYSVKNIETGGMGGRR